MKSIAVHSKTAGDFVPTVSLEGEGAGTESKIKINDLQKLFCSRERVQA